MKSKVLLLFVLAILCLGLSAKSNLDPDQYRMKVGDAFLVHIMGADSMRVFVPVQPEGIIKLPPLTDALQVAGLTLHEAKSMLEGAIRENIKRGYVSVELFELGPTRFHVTGAVTTPGEYYSEKMVTLSHALAQSGGLLPYSSRKIEIIRDGRKTTYDLRKYLSDGDLTQNPLIMEDDIVFVPFAKDYAKVYVSNDTTYVVEYYELDKETPSRDIFLNLGHKLKWSEFDRITAFRNGELIKTNTDFLVAPGDSVFVSVEAAFVYVTGNIPEPGPYPYISGGSIIQYVSKAGGLLNTGSLRKAKVYAPDGHRKDLAVEPIRPGDTVHIPQNTLSWMQNYLTTLSIIAGIVSSAILINANIK